MYYVKFGETLRQLRRARGLSQKELGDRLGLSKAVISKYENNLSYPAYDVLIKIATLFGVSTDYLLGHTSGKYVSVAGLDEEAVEEITRLIALLRK